GWEIPGVDRDVHLVMRSIGWRQRTGRRAAIRVDVPVIVGEDILEGAPRKPRSLAAGADQGAIGPEHPLVLFRRIPLHAAPRVRVVPAFHAYLVAVVHERRAAGGQKKNRGEPRAV